MIQLEKGSSINLTKDAPNLVSTRIRLEWDPIKAVSGGLFNRLFSSVITLKQYDLDAFVNVLNEGGNEVDKIYYGNLSNSNKSIVHAGDDLTGAGEGEEIRIELNKLDSKVQKLDIFTNIYNASSKGQNFGEVKNAKVTLYNDSTNELICEYKLGDEFSKDTSVHFGSLEKINNEWSFVAVGKGS